MPYSPAAHLAGRDLDKHDVHQRHGAAERGEASRARATTEPVDVPRGRATRTWRSRLSEPTSLPSMFPPESAVRAAFPAASMRHRHQRRRRSRRAPSRRRARTLLAVADQRAERARSTRTGSPRSRNIWKKFVSGLGFSNGCAELRVVEPAAVVAELSIDSLRRHRSARDCLRATGHGLTRLELVEVLITPCDDEDQRRTRTRSAAGSRMRRRTMSAQKLPMVSDSRAGEATDERDRRRPCPPPRRRSSGPRDRSSARGDTMVDLARSRTASSCWSGTTRAVLERLVRVDAAEAERERQAALHPLEDVEQHDRAERERQERHRVRGPALLERLIDAGGAMDPPFDTERAVGRVDPAPRSRRAGDTPPRAPRRGRGAAPSRSCVRSAPGRGGPRPDTARGRRR